jgi:hypothetical protein
MNDLIVQWTLGDRPLPNQQRSKLRGIYPVGMTQDKSRTGFQPVARYGNSQDACAALEPINASPTPHGLEVGTDSLAAPIASSSRQVQPHIPDLLIRPRVRSDPFSGQSAPIHRWSRN